MATSSFLITKKIEDSYDREYVECFRVSPEDIPWLSTGNLTVTPYDSSKIKAEQTTTEHPLTSISEISNTRFCWYADQEMSGKTSKSLTLAAGLQITVDSAGESEQSIRPTDYLLEIDNLGVGTGIWEATIPGHNPAPYPVQFPIDDQLTTPIDLQKLGNAAGDSEVIFTYPALILRETPPSRQKVLFEINNLPPIVNLCSRCRLKQHYKLGNPMQCDYVTKQIKEVSSSVFKTNERISIVGKIYLRDCISIKDGVISGYKVVAGKERLPSKEEERMLFKTCAYFRKFSQSVFS